jgi:hypothetical protein
MIRTDFPASLSSLAMTVPVSPDPIMVYSGFMDAHPDTPSSFPAPFQKTLILAAFLATNRLGNNPASPIITSGEHI